MKISVIVPVYNTNPLFLKPLLLILEKLDKENFEVIIIDDCSNNQSTINLVNLYKGKDNFVLVTNRYNSGVAFSRNVGIKMSKNPFICFIDSDDLVDYELLNKVASSKLDADMIVFKRKFINEKTFSIQSDIGDLLVLENKLGFLDIFCSRHLPEQYSDYALRGLRCKIIRKEFLNTNQILFNVELRQYEDTVFIANFANLNANVIFLKNYCDYYRINKKSISHSFDKNYNEKLFLYCDVFKNKFGNNASLMKYFYQSLFYTYLPIRCWVTFKKFHWKLGIEFLKNERFVDGVDELDFSNKRNIKISNYLKKHSFVRLYFYLNFSHFRKAIFKR